MPEGGNSCGPPLLSYRVPPERGFLLLAAACSPIPGPNGVKLFLQKTLSVTGAVDFLLLRRGGKVMLRGRRPSAPAYVHFGGPKMDATSEATHEVKRAWLAEDDLRPTSAPPRGMTLQAPEIYRTSLPFVRLSPRLLPRFAQGAGMIHFGRSATLGLQAVIF